jgi:hypothetical protein
MFAGKPSGELIPTAYYYKLIGEPPRALEPRPAGARTLASCVAALKTGWSPDNSRPQAGQEVLQRIEKDPDAFLALQVDREAKGPPSSLPDGTQVQRIPGYVLWMWDGEFCGSIGVSMAARNDRPATDLPSTHRLCRGAVEAPPRIRETRGRLMLERVRAEGLAASRDHLRHRQRGFPTHDRCQRGVLVELFKPLPSIGDKPKLRYRVPVNA